MKLKLALLIGLMFSALQASELKRIAGDESAKDFSEPADSSSEDEHDQKSIGKPQRAESLDQLKSHNFVGSVATGMTDDERLAAAIKASLELDQKRRVFQSAQADAAQSPKSPLRKVAFEVVMRNALNVMSSKDPSKLQGAIYNVKAIQRNNILTDDQFNQVDQMLIDLACALSVITNHEKLGAH